MSDTCKYFLHELGKSSSLKNAITPRNKYALQFSFKHYLGDGWYESVLKIYAQLSRDITFIIKDSIKYDRFIQNAEQLYNLLKFAPNTEEKYKYHCEGYIEQLEEEEQIFYTEDEYLDIEENYDRKNLFYS